MQIHTYKAYYIHSFAHCFFPPTSPHDLGNCAILVRRAALLISKAAQYSTLCIYCNLLYKSSVDGHLVCFQSLAVINFLVQTSWCTCMYISEKQIFRNGIVGQRVYAF